MPLSAARHKSSAVISDGQMRLDTSPIKVAAFAPIAHGLKTPDRAPRGTDVDTNQARDSDGKSRRSLSMDEGRKLLHSDVTYQYMPEGR